MLKVVHGFGGMRIYIFVGCITFLVGLIAFASVFNSAHAANSADMEASVTIKPSLTLNIPTSNITMNLDPSTHAFDEKDLTVSVGTNNRYGYQLMINTTGTNLTNVADNTKTIPTLADSVAPANFPVNKWGIRKTADSTSSSGNYGTFSTPYAVSSSTGPVNNNVTTIGFGAKIDYTKESGLYNLNLEFKALPKVTQEYMQGLDPEFCTDDPTVVIDQRDGQAYTIRRINGDCWMVDNLRFTGVPDDQTGKMTLKSDTSNVATDTTLTYYDLSINGGSGGECYGEYNSGVGVGAGYTNPCLYRGSNAYTQGSTVWYNYAVASAGTITGVDNNNPQIYDICPAGWRMPNQTEFDGISSYISAFAPVGGGYWANNTSHGGASGLWWSSNYASYGSNRIRFSSDGTTAETAGAYRRTGLYVRCIMKDTTIYNLTYMQDFAKIDSNTKPKVVASMAPNTTTGYSLIDSRDSKTYTVKKLGPDGNQSVWMTDNLRYMQNTSNPNTTAFSVSPDDSDVPSAVSFTAYDLVTYGGSGKNCYGTYDGSTPSSSAGAGYTTPCVHSSSNNNYGVWYNYATATAYQIRTAGSSTTVANATRSICPKGWTLPDYDTQSSYVATGGTKYYTVFNTVGGGYLVNGSNHGQDLMNSAWWTSTAVTPQRYWYIRNNQSEGKLMSNAYWQGSTDGRYDGFYVRCTARI